MSLEKQFSNAILFTRGTKGDLYPFIRIGQGLQSKQCKVNLLSNYCYDSYADQAGFDFVALDDEESFEILNNTFEYHSQLPAKLKLYRDHIISHMEKEVAMIESKYVKDNTVILAHSNDYLSPMFAAEKLGMPLYLCILAPSFVYGFSLFEAVLRNLSDELNAIRSRLELRPVIDWKNWLSGFNRCYAFWPQWFSNEIEDFVQQTSYLGFLSIDSVEEQALQQEVHDFLERRSNGEKTILITHGTSKPFNDSYFQRAIEACQTLDCRLIISTPFRELLPAELGENVLWMKFCPFHELLPLVDMIIHHGGIGTAREAVAKCVRQIVIGQGFDRQHNGKIIKALKLGGWVSPKALSTDSLRQTITELFADKRFVARCDDYRNRIYDTKAVDDFYDDVLHFDVLLMKFAQSSTETTSSAVNSAAVVDVNSIGKDQKALLLKMLKEKAKKATLLGSDVVGEGKNCDR